MYRYEELDQRIVDERVAEFRDQTTRYLAGELAEDHYRELRLRNGLYLQRHAYMLRVAIPYGLLSSTQLRALAAIADSYDRGYGHFTTRQNIQFNWIDVARVPDLLADLAKVQMHAIQTSGNCVRNITADPLAGVCADEVEDPRPWAELLREYSTLHPEFNYLPRKFKIAITGRQKDGAAIAFHDLGLRLVKNDGGEIGFEVHAGGGMGRTPIIATLIRAFLPPQHLLSYVEALLRVYNLEGNRDNKYRARIKILLRDLGCAEFTRRVEACWQELKGGPTRLDLREVERIKGRFTRPNYEHLGVDDFDSHAGDVRFARFLRQNVKGHKVPGYCTVFISLKRRGQAPGDISGGQMRAVADLADAYSFGLIRSLHEQNLLLADVPRAQLYVLWQKLATLELATPNIGTLTDLICCPGLDFCSLADAESISVAKAIIDRFDRVDYLHDLGELKLKMSGCLNSCGHHHAGHIGILGIDKKGEQWYKFLLGGSEGEDASLARSLGPAVPQTQVVLALERLLETFIELRAEGERFLDVVRREGIDAFSARVYADFDPNSGFVLEQVA